MTADTAHMMKSADQKVLKALPGNDRCIDCGRQGPEWASVSLGIFVCLECSGHHRSLGTHVSFVRSVKMDSWTDAQVNAMKASGGNDAVRNFLSERAGIDMDYLAETPTPIREKYDSRGGEWFRQILKARVNGTPEPTEPRPELEASSDSDEENKTYHSIRGGGGAVGGATKIKMEGFGSSPHPSELKKKKVGKRAKKILGAGAAAIGAIAAAGLAARSRSRKPPRLSKHV